jgi:hypothetical protein
MDIALPSGSKTMRRCFIDRVALAAHDPRPGARTPYRVKNCEMRRLLADLMPDFPARASLLAPNLPSASWFGHAFL